MWPKESSLINRWHPSQKPQLKLQRHNLCLWRRWSKRTRLERQAKIRGMERWLLCGKRKKEISKSCQAHRGCTIHHSTWRTFRNVLNHSINLIFTQLLSILWLFFLNKNKRSTERRSSQQQADPILLLAQLPGWYLILLRKNGARAPSASPGNRWSYGAHLSLTSLLWGTSLELPSSFFFSFFLFYIFLLEFTREKEEWLTAEWYNWIQSMMACVCI